MTRGTIYTLLPDEKIITSCEFNGDMYEGGHYEDVVEMLVRINNEDDFKKEVVEFDNETFKYNEDNKYTEGEDVKTYYIKDGIYPDDYEYFSFRIFDYKNFFNVDKELRLKVMMDVVNYSDYEFIKNCSGDVVKLIDEEGVKIELKQAEIATFCYGSFLRVFDSTKGVEEIKKEMKENLEKINKKDN